MEELREIKSKRISAEECAQRVLLTWLEREVTSWATLVWALNEVGATDLAYKIASKYSKIIQPCLASVSEPHTSRSQARLALCVDLSPIP